MPDPDRALAELARVMRPDGVALVAGVPAGDWTLWATHDSAGRVKRALEVEEGAEPTLVRFVLDEAE